MSWMYPRRQRSGILLATVCAGAVLAMTIAVAAQQNAPRNQEQQVLITQGPVVESTSARSAVIAWSTNVSAGTVVRYGTDPNRLDVRAEMPWGGYTHRVTLRNLQSDTVYYFQASSPDAAGSGGSVSSDVMQFTTHL